MIQNKKQLTRLTGLLKDLFQLDQPELDFGLYKIMHAKSVQITHFLENDLLKEIENAFGARDGANAEQLITQAKAELFKTLGDTALDTNGNLNAAFAGLPAGKKYLDDMAAAEQAKDALSSDAEIFDHLYRFFERYYDNGDFLSKRYYARENDTRAAPYSVPYDGREVYLHWANKDQYYIKSGENFNHYTFDLIEAVKKLMQSKGAESNDVSDGLGLEVPNIKEDGNPLKVHLRIAEAQEGEHGNIKTAGDQKREFIPLLERPAEINALGELVLNFEYKVLTNSYPFDETAIKAKFGNINKGDMPAHWMADVFMQAISAIAGENNESNASKTIAIYTRLLNVLAPTDKQAKRPLLAKYISLYTARNTMDYFIHKDLGGFLRRELDFYIKNEVMRLDDIESAEAPKVEQVLGKIKVLRRIAHQLIAFLAQLEDFQKKLWLKKKFVTETNYCITLDRVPEHLYPAIAANDAQREEWVKLFAIDDIKGDIATVAYSAPLTVEFLKANPFMLLDTALFDEVFKAALLASMNNFDAQCDGVLIHSENFQALGLMQGKYKEQVKCVYIDPPYNTDASAISYKNGYKSSSWISLMDNRLETTKNLITKNGVLVAAIDDAQQRELSLLVDNTFNNNLLGTICVRSNPSGRPTQSGYAVSHEYLIFAGKTSNSIIGRLPPTLDQMSRFNQTDEFGVFEWRNLRREGSNSDRTARPWLFYPIYICNGKIRVPKMTADTAAQLWIIDEKPSDEEQVVYPVNEDGIEKTWRWEFKKVTSSLEELAVRKDREGKDYIYLKRRPNDDGVVSVSSWFDAKYSATEHGTAVLKNIFGVNYFSYPKSIHAVIDSIYVAGASNRDSKVLDYFGGSGTTAHAVMNLNREDNGARKYMLVEQNNYFDTVIRPRLQKIAYSCDWKDGKPVSRDGVSHCFKYIRLESYEDALNNLVVKDDAARDLALEGNADLRSAYLLNYWLDIETQGSPSLLNVQAFADPTNYVMNIKKPGSDAQALQKVDLIETFNWLLGLWVEHMAAPQSFAAEFEREVDKDLPKDQNTRLVCTRLKMDKVGDDQGPYWFRLVEGYTLKVPGDDTTRQKTLVVWRKLTDDAEKDNAALQKFLMEKLGISPREKTYAVIYINGSHTLPNPLIDGEHTKVRLIEEAFHNAMWSQADSGSGMSARQ